MPYGPSPMRAGEGDRPEPVIGPGERRDTRVIGAVIFPLWGTVTPEGRQPDRHLVGERADVFAVGGGPVREYFARHGPALC